MKTKLKCEKIVSELFDSIWGDQKQVSDKPIYSKEKTKRNMSTGRCISKSEHMTHEECIAYNNAYFTRNKEKYENILKNI